MNKWFKGEDFIIPAKYGIEFEFLYDIGKIIVRFKQAEKIIFEETLGNFLNAKNEYVDVSELAWIGRELWSHIIYFLSKQSNESVFYIQEMGDRVQKTYNKVVKNYESAKKQYGDLPSPF